MPEAIFDDLMSKNNFKLNRNKAIMHYLGHTFVFAPKNHVGNSSYSVF